MDWLPLIGTVLGLIALGWGIGRGMRTKDESIARINRSGLDHRDIWGG